MASGEGSPEEVFTGPWDPYAEGTDPFDHEGGDKETLPLIEVGSDNKDQVRPTLSPKDPGMIQVIIPSYKIYGHPRLTSWRREKRPQTSLMLILLYLMFQ